MTTYFRNDSSRCRHHCLVPHVLSLKHTAIMTILCLMLFIPACSRPSSAPAFPAPEVATITIFQQEILMTTELPGRTSPYVIAEIRPQVSGLIQKRLFKEGSEVQAGQVLYQIDPAPFQAALDNANAALGKAKANVPAIRSRVARYKDALSEKAVSQQDFDDASAALRLAQADVRVARAMVKTARINLGYTQVLAPISGRIGKSSVTDGAIVTAYQPMTLATIQQLDPIYVDVPQSTGEMLRLKRRLEDGHIHSDGESQNKVHLILEDGTKYPLEGTLEFRDVSVDSSTSSVMMRMVFPNPNTVLLPGMYARAVVKEGINKQAILIPQQAVSHDPKGNALALVVNTEGKVEQRMIKLDRAIQNQWLVASGLSIGDHVIVEGMIKARPGMPVKEVPFEENVEPQTDSASTTQSAAKTN